MPEGSARSLPNRKAFVKIALSGQCLVTGMQGLLPLAAAAQGAPAPAAVAQAATPAPITPTPPAEPAPTIPTAPITGTTIIPTDATPFFAGQGALTPFENLQIRLLQKLPARLYLSGSAEASFRLETNPFQFPNKRQLLKQLPSPEEISQLEPEQQDQIRRLLSQVNAENMVFRILPNVTVGWTLTPRTRLFSNYFMISDTLFKSHILNTVINSIAWGVQRDFPVAGRGNLLFEMQNRTLTQTNQPVLFDFIPGFTFSYILNPRTVLFANALLQLRGTRYFVAPTREIDPFYTWGALYQRTGWTFSVSSTLVQNFREPFRGNASIPQDNYAFILDFEVARRLFRQFPGLQAFVRAEPIFNFHSKQRPGLAGTDFRLFFGTRFAFAKPSLTASLEQIREQLQEQETAPGTRPSASAPFDTIAYGAGQLSGSPGEGVSGDPAAPASGAGLFGSQLASLGLSADDVSLKSMLRELVPQALTTTASIDALTERADAVNHGMTAEGSRSNDRFVTALAEEKAIQLPDDGPPLLFEPERIALSFADHDTDPDLTSSQQAGQESQMEVAQTAPPIAMRIFTAAPAAQLPPSDTVTAMNSDSTDRSVKQPGQDVVASQPAPQVLPVEPPSNSEQRRASVDAVPGFELASAGVDWSDVLSLTEQPSGAIAAAHQLQSLRAPFDLTASGSAARAANLTAYIKKRPQPVEAPADLPGLAVASTGVDWSDVLSLTEQPSGAIAAAHQLQSLRAPFDLTASGSAARAANLTAYIKKRPQPVEAPADLPGLAVASTGVDWSDVLSLTEQPSGAIAAAHQLQSLRAPFDLTASGSAARAANLTAYIKKRPQPVEAPADLPGLAVASTGVDWSDVLSLTEQPSGAIAAAHQLQSLRAPFDLTASGSAARAANLTAYIKKRPQPVEALADLPGLAVASTGVDWFDVLSLTEQPSGAIAAAHQLQSLRAPFDSAASASAGRAANLTAYIKKRPQPVEAPADLPGLAVASTGVDWSDVLSLTEQPSGAIAATHQLQSLRAPFDSAASASAGRAANLTAYIKRAEAERIRLYDIRQSRDSFELPSSAVATLILPDVCWLNLVTHRSTTMPGARRQPDFTAFVRSLPSYAELRSARLAGGTRPPTEVVVSRDMHAADWRRRPFAVGEAPAVQPRFDLAGAEVDWSGALALALTAQPSAAFAATNQRLSLHAPLDSAAWRSAQPAVDLTAYVKRADRRAVQMYDIRLSEHLFHLPQGALRFVTLADLSTVNALTRNSGSLTQAPRKAMFTAFVRSLPAPSEQAASRAAAEPALKPVPTRLAASDTAVEPTIKPAPSKLGATGAVAAEKVADFTRQLARQVDTIELSTCQVDWSAACAQAISRILSPPDSRLMHFLIHNAARRAPVTVAFVPGMLNSSFVTPIKPVSRPPAVPSARSPGAARSPVLWMNAPAGAPAPPTLPSTPLPGERTGIAAQRWTEGAKSGARKKSVSMRIVPPLPSVEIHGKDPFRNTDIKLTRPLMHKGLH